MSSTLFESKGVLELKLCSREASTSVSVISRSVGSNDPSTTVFGSSGMKVRFFAIDSNDFNAPPCKMQNLKCTSCKRGNTMGWAVYHTGYDSGVVTRGTTRSLLKYPRRYVLPPMPTV